MFESVPEGTMVAPNRQSDVIVEICINMQQGDLIDAHSWECLVGPSSPKKIDTGGSELRLKKFFAPLRRGRLATAVSAGGEPTGHDQALL
jgi:hypothetical protein